jgi:predicted transcriptional regulator of viral defense system
MHDKESGRPDHDTLFQIASGQGGYFTAAQARDCGFSWALLAYHSKRGRFLRIQQGLYRLRDYPSSPREEVMAAWLAAGSDVAVVSHESALDLHGLSDVIPEVVHLTVPRSKRYRPASPGVAVHTSTRSPGAKDISVVDGIRVTTPARSIIDAAEAGTAPEQIIAAAHQALERGMTTENQLLGAARQNGARVAQLIEHAIEQVRAP